jgi:hypothetical protein
MARARAVNISSLEESPAVEIRKACPWFLAAKVGARLEENTSVSIFQASSISTMLEE